MIEFMALACGTVLQVERHALTLPVYGVDPLQGLAQAVDDMEKAMAHFAAEEGETEEDADPLRNLDKLSTPAEFADRLQRLAELYAYLGQHLPVQSETPSYRRHLLFSSIPFVLRADGEPNFQYAVLSATGLASIWSRTANGEFVLTGVVPVSE